MATTLNNQISALATQVGTDIKQIIANVGDLSKLTTTQKASLVVALNELKANLQDVAASVSATIDDSAIHSDLRGQAPRSIRRSRQRSMTL